MGKGFLNEGVLSRKYVQGRMQVPAGTVASTCGDGCKYVRGRLQVRASEMGKTGT